jgi:hypothetical protein
VLAILGIYISNEVRLEFWTAPTLVSSGATLFSQRERREREREREKEM